MPKSPVECDQLHAGLAVTDVSAAIEFYTKKLGFFLAFTDGDPVSFAGVNLGDVQIFLQKGEPDPKGCTVWFLVDSADDLFALHERNGVEVLQPPTDQPYGIRNYVVHDLHGYTLIFGEHLMNAGPALEIERVDVPVRLEKRLAALLQDLATYKRMSVSSCLEEILLHTNEPLGDGVASPHTKRQLAHIQELKKKHSIDYDSHASYRFRERT